MRVFVAFCLVVALTPGLLLAQTDSDECSESVDEMFDDQDSLAVPNGDESQDELIEGYLLAMALRRKYEDIDAGDCTDIGFSGPRVASYFAGVQDAYALLIFTEIAPQRSDDLLEVLEATQERIDILGRELIFGLF